MSTAKAALILLLLAGCAPAHLAGCGLGTPDVPLDSGVYFGPSQGLLSDLRAGEPVVCRLKIPLEPELNR